MNANELADELDNMLKAIGLTDNRVPAMLRQQQADLKDADKYALELERLYEDAKAEIEALKKRLENPVGAFGIERAYEAGKQTAQAEIEEMKTAVRSFFNDYFKKQSKKIDKQQAEIEALKEPREIFIKGGLYLANVLPDGGMEVRLKKAMI